MSIECVSWALKVPVGGNMKVVLLGLANHAHPDGTDAYPALDTLAGYAYCDRSTARRNVRKLVELGWIREDGFGPKGQTKYTLAMSDRPRFADRGGDSPPVASEPDGGGTRDLGGVAPMPPEPSIEPSIEPSSGSGSARVAPELVPDGFPDELRPHARAVLRVLRSVAEHHNAKAVSSAALAHVLMARPRHPLVRAAHDFAAWSMTAPPRRDVVAGYRNWLDKCSELAGTERLPGEDGPAVPANVHALHGRRLSNAEQVQANLEALSAARAALSRDG